METETPSGSTPGFGSMFSYVWANSRREQLLILALVIFSMPFYFAALDLPKSIVNDAIQGRAFTGQQTHVALFHLTLRLPAFLGGGALVDFAGFPVTRLGYLFSLCGLFLALVLINGGFKYLINLKKGKLGERVLRKLRFDLFSRLLQFTPEAVRNVKPSEAATIIKDEVEPIGGFVGDAFIQPVFLGGQAATALLFICLQSVSLGLLTATVVAIQGVAIPRLRREQLRLSKERQLKSRQLAGRVGEIVEGMAEVRNHSTGAYERLKITDMLDQLFLIRYRLFDRKFRVKFLNNFIAQLTPFLFYSIGGYYALTGALDIGQLVAVIAAYRDVPPPVKELIDWDQQRLDVEVKFNQVVEQFSGAEERPSASALDLPRFEGLIEIQGLRILGSAGETLLDGASFSIPIGSQIGLFASSGDGASAFAQALGRRITSYGGAIKINGRELAEINGEALGRRIAYVSANATIFQGTIRDNVVYGLRVAATEPAGEEFDYALADAAGPTDLDARVIDALSVAGMDDTIYRIGLNRTIDPVFDPEFSQRIVTARARLSALLAEDGAGRLIDRFSRTEFNANATIGENLLFGVAKKDELASKQMAAHPYVRRLLHDEGLNDPLRDIGRRMASTLIEIFGDLRGDHFLEQFAFISFEEAPIYREILARAAQTGPDGINPSDSDRLINLALRYSEPRHRLGLLTAAARDKILRARAKFMRADDRELAGAVEFYDPDRYCGAATLRENLLFGSIAHDLPGAARKAQEYLRRALREQDLERDVMRLGLDQPVGLNGCLLQPTQRIAVALARCLIKRLDILILDQPLTAFDQVEAALVMDRVRNRMNNQTLFVVTRDRNAALGFDAAIEFEGALAKPSSGARDLAAIAPASKPASTDQSAISREVETLRSLSVFADVDPAQLKFLAFASDRMSFAGGDIIFRQGAASDAAYVMLSGACEARIEATSGPLHLSTITAPAIIGEMGVISGEPRSATVVARSDIVALRLSRETLLGLLSQFPPMALAMMRDQIRRLVAAEGRLALDRKAN